MALRNFANSDIRSTNIATVGVHWVCYMTALAVSFRQTAERAAGKHHIHIGVGFCVARSDCMGNAKASKSGTATVQTPALFRIYAPFNQNRSAPGSLTETTRKTNMEKVTFILGRSGMAAENFLTTNEAMNAVKKRKGILKGMGESYEWDKDGIARKFTIAWVEEDETHNLFAIDPQCMRTDE